MKAKEIQYKTFGNCLELRNDTVKVLVTLDFGPRIIRYSFLDGENMFFEDTDHAFSEMNAGMEALYGAGKAWKLYGGHRLWKSPEEMVKTYYPDNNPVAYTLTENGAVFTPPVQAETGYGYEIAVSIAETGPGVTVEHRFTNHGEEPVELALWPITVLPPGGTEIVPQPTRKTGAVPKMRMAFWHYVKMTDKRLVWLDRYIALRQDPEADGKMKFGINNEHGFAMYFHHGDLFVNTFDPVLDGVYPDGGMSFETYTNPLFLEMETLGELKTVSSGETITHTERWALYKEELPALTDEALDKIRDEYIG